MSGESELKAIVEDDKKPITLVTPEPAMKEKFSIRLSSETRRGLKALAKKYNCSMAEIMRQLVDQGLQSVKNSQTK